MKIVSWNIAFGRNAELAASELRGIEPLAGADIVLLQEMDLPSTAMIADALGATFGFRAADLHRRTGRDFGNAVVSRWPITDVNEIPLPHVAAFGGQPRSATRANVCVRGVDVAAYSVHTEVPLLRLARRGDQYDEVSTDVASHTDAAPNAAITVVGGDFNTVTDRGIRRLDGAMSSVGLVRATAATGATMHRFGRGLVLDHIFVRAADITGCGVATDATASDHDPLWVTIRPL